MGVVWDRGEEHYDPAHKQDILDRTKTRLELWKNTSKTRWRHWRKHWNVFENSFQGWHLVAQFCRCQRLSSQWLSASVVRKLCLEGVWPYLHAWDVVRLRRSSWFWNVQRKHGPHGELFFFLMKEPFALTEAVKFKPFVPAQTLKACASIGLHLLAAEGESGSSRRQSPDLGHMRRRGCPKSPNLDSNLHVIGLNWSGEKVSLSWKTGDLRGP